MKIEISGSVCVTCAKFTQYYSKNWNGELNAIDCGFCGQKGKHVRPGDRCGYYHEKSNIGFIAPIALKKKEVRRSAAEFKRSPSESGHDTTAGGGVSGSLRKTL